MKKITLKQVADAVNRVHGWCSYYAGSNETIGPYNVRNLDGPTTSVCYDRRRSWDTGIAIALAEEAFGVDLSLYAIVDRGPWRNTVRSIRDAIASEFQAETEYQMELSSGNAQE